MNYFKTNFFNSIGHQLQYQQPKLPLGTAKHRPAILANIEAQLRQVCSSMCSTPTRTPIRRSRRASGFDIAFQHRQAYHMPHAPAIACLLVLTVFAPLPAESVSDPCVSFLVGGRQPTLINPKLDQDTYLLCSQGFADLASGATRG